MADTVKSERLALWQAGFNLFGAHFKEWLSIAVWFCALTIAAQVLFYDPAIKQFLQSVGDGVPSRMPVGEINRNLTVLFYHMVPSLIAIMVIELIQSFSYVVLFMQVQKPIVGAPVFTIGRFFWWCGNLILMVAVGAAMGGVLGGLPIGLGVALRGINPYCLVAGILIGLAGFCFALFVIYRLTLVASLAACNVDRPFETSWRLMKGNCWRIFGNVFVMLMIVMILMGVAAVAERLVTELLFSIFPGMFSAFSGPDTKPQQSTVLRLLGPAGEQPYGPIGVYLDIVFQSINLCFMVGVERAFVAATTHIIYHEHQAVAPIATPVLSSVAPVTPPRAPSV